MGGLLEHYQEDPQYKIVEALANWDHLELPKISNEHLLTLSIFYAKLVELRKEELIAKDRTVGLTDDEKRVCSLMFQ